VSFTAVHVRN